ncbi:hypothetical protein SAMN05421749_11412 [Acinetobacter marinus]|uniref:Uncharacterized protein n=1 Tax=Acinetobacter marinus TaxID=281375 RepID=A0A1G6PB23_9GAMM|nr:hypothetical protein [Acinetobacter marinus]SDC77480.1 hypothetical protein SAMN05421749_11412 [Acinetobacter marinus]
MKKTIFVALLSISSLSFAESKEADCEALVVATDLLMTMHQLGNDIEDSKSTYTNQFKEESAVFIQIIDEAKTFPVYADETQPETYDEAKAEQVLEAFNQDWKRRCLAGDVPKS